MKKIIIALIVLIGFSTQAQRRNQEVSIDLGNALVMKSLSITYEYYLSDQSSVGISGLYNFEKETSDFRYNEKTVITPFFRHYFTTNQNWNHFGEVFLGINSGKDKKENLTYVDYTDGALGVSFGSKYISNGGFVVSALAGIGRNMFSDNSPIIVPRAGLSLGYRF